MSASEELANAVSQQWVVQNHQVRGKIPVPKKIRSVGFLGHNDPFGSSSVACLHEITPLEDKMIHQGANPEATDLLNKLINDGLIINFYSDEYAESHAEHGLISTEKLAELVETHGTDFKDSLLVVLNDKSSDTVNNITHIYPALSDLFDEDKYEPNFIFINLRSQQFYYIGIARKGNLFDGYGNLDGTDCEGDDESFKQHDHLAIIEDIYNTLSTFAESNYELGWDAIDEGLIDDAIERGPDADGLYFCRDDDDAEGMTLEELEDKKEYLEELSSDISASLETLSIYFPQAGIEFEIFAVDD